MRKDRFWAMRYQAVAPSRMPIVMEPMPSQTGLPVKCTNAVAIPAHMHVAFAVAAILSRECACTVVASTVRQTCCRQAHLHAAMQAHELHAAPTSNEQASDSSSIFEHDSNRSRVGATLEVLPEAEAGRGGSLQYGLRGHQQRVALHEERQHQHCMTALASAGGRPPAKHAASVSAGCPARLTGGARDCACCKRYRLVCLDEACLPGQPCTVLLWPACMCCISITASR